MNIEINDQNQSNHNHVPSHCVSTEVGDSSVIKIRMRFKKGDGQAEAIFNALQICTCISEVCTKML